jgi:ABC-type glycerol-3-phosphate transport system permease component
MASTATAGLSRRAQETAHPTGRMRLGHIARNAVLYAAMSMIGLISILPFLWALGASLRPHQEIFGSVVPFGLRTFIPAPGSLSLAAYAHIFTQDYFGRYLFNSAFVATATVALGVLVNSMAGFGFGRFRFAGQSLLFALVLVTFMVPFEIIVLPLYLVVRDLNWQDTYQALILPAVADAFSIFLIRQFIRELPADLVDAARVDGASWWTIYARILLPLIKPALITAGLLQFIRQWDAFFWPLVAVSSRELTVTQVGLTRYVTEYVTYWDRLLAAAVAASLPVLVLFFLLQRYYVRGIAASGLK